MVSSPPPLNQNQNQHQHQQAQAGAATGGGDTEYDAPTLLYILATNFLLYVALVLITYLVVKLYIESAPGNPLFEEATTYNRVPATHSGLELTSLTVQVWCGVAWRGVA